jgi:hypothetical protein
MHVIIQNNLAVILASILVIELIALILSLFLLIRLARINKQNKILFSGKDAKSLESVILTHAQELKDMDKEIQELFEVSNKINKLALHSLHKIGVIRFNPFKDIGGDQSFAIALLDGKNSGLVISSLHTREGTRVYTKPVTKGESKKYPLTEEEKQAIKIASPIKEGNI